MFSSTVKTDGRNEDGMGGYSPDSKCRVAHYLTVMSWYSLAPLANAHHVQQGSGEDQPR